MTGANRLKVTVGNCSTFLFNWNLFICGEELPTINVSMNEKLWLTLLKK